MKKCIIKRVIYLKLLWNFLFNFGWVVMEFLMKKLIIIKFYGYIFIF